MKPKGYPLFHIRPERFESGKGWVECPHHRAVAYACYKGQRLLGRERRVVDACALLEANRARHAKNPRGYVLGQRMQPRLPANKVGTVVKITK